LTWQNGDWPGFSLVLVCQGQLTRKRAPRPHGLSTINFFEAFDLSGISSLPQIYGSRPSRSNRQRPSPPLSVGSGPLCLVEKQRPFSVVLKAAHSESGLESPRVLSSALPFSILFVNNLVRVHPGGPNTHFVLDFEWLRLVVTSGSLARRPKRSLRCILVEVS